LARRIGVRWNHVPYRGNVHAATGLARGDVRLLMGGAGALPLVRTGKLRIIAVTSPERAPTLPDIPAVAEFVPGFHGIAWFGIFGRAGCDAAQLAEMLEATRRAVGDPRTHVLLRERGNMTALFAGPEALTALIEAERRRFAAIVARLP
jgi:tripartite-type tricarboxylate transporter receptor subunit TctC